MTHEQELREWAKPEEPQGSDPVVEAEFLPAPPAVICADERSYERYAAMEREEQWPAVLYEAERWEGSR